MQTRKQMFGSLWGRSSSQINPTPVNESQAPLQKIKNKSPKWAKYSRFSALVKIGECVNTPSSFSPAHRHKLFVLNAFHKRSAGPLFGARLQTRRLWARAQIHTKRRSSDQSVQQNRGAQAGVGQKKSCCMFYGFYSNPSSVCSLAVLGICFRFLNPQ